MTPEIEYPSIDDQGFLTDDEHEFPLDLEAGLEFDGRQANTRTPTVRALEQTMRERLFEGWEDHSIEVYAYDDAAPPKSFSEDPAAENMRRWAAEVAPLDAHVRKCHRMFSTTPRLVKSISSR